MSLSLQEQETTINFYRDSDLASVYTSDRTVMTRLDKLAESDEYPDWKLLKVNRSMEDKEIVSKVYETKKRLISFRSTIVQRELSEEQRQMYRERVKHMQECRREKEEKESGDSK